MLIVQSSLSPLLARLRGGLIVSCQALPDEPLFRLGNHGRLALAAKQGGAVGIRANTPPDIAAIKASVPDLPLVGLWKVVVPGYQDVYITPRLKDAQLVADAGADIIAVDATDRPHPPDGHTAGELIRTVKAATGKLVMADISTLDEAVAAAHAGADVISTTLSGYTPYSPSKKPPTSTSSPNLRALTFPSRSSPRGRISTPDEARAALDAGAWAVVVGGAITRPQQITERFAGALVSSYKLRKKRQFGQSE
jgi:N-acylglucosamine-6-phosphate 2-epimerase